VARTSRVCVPSARALVVCGVVHALQLPPSTRHSKVAPISLELNWKLGVVSFDGLDGLESIVVFGAVRSTVHVWDAGVASVLPAGSVARTSKVWLPAPSALVVWGLVQAFQLPPSTRHSNVEPASLELNWKLGVVLFDGLAGPLSIVVFGAVRSIVHVCDAGVPSVFPAMSVARTSKVWLPAPSALVAWGLVQGFQLPPSTRHSKVEPGSLPLKANDGVGLFDVFAGPLSIVVFGAVMSIVQVKLAGVASVLPTPSVACTSKVCVPSASALVV